jgi:hypothetical protein
MHGRRQRAAASAISLEGVALDSESARRTATRVQARWSAKCVGAYNPYVSAIKYCRSPARAAAADLGLLAFAETLARMVINPRTEKR